MRILVTGATGFLGSHLCRRLADEGHAVTAFSRAESDLAPLAGIPVAHAVGDVTDPASLDRAIAGQDAVVHAAANLRYATLSQELRNSQERVNVEGTRDVARACRRHGVSRLVHVSTMVTIDPPADADHAADETSPFSLRERGFAYHFAKRAAEEAIGEEIAAGLDAVIVNPGAIWGPFGRSYRGAEIFEQVRRRRVVFYYRGGISVVHVGDVAEGVARALARGRTGERYILAGENLTIERIARVAADSLGVRRTLVPIPRLVTGLASALLAPVSRITGRRPRVTREIHYFSGRYQFYDSSKAARELGYRPRPFREIARECANFVLRPGAPR